VHVHVVDQSSRTDLQQLAEADGPFDVIIDDGSHLNAHQIFTFQTLYPHLKEQSIYVVEDVQTSYWKDLGGHSVNSEKFGETCMGYFCELAKYLNHAEFQSVDGLSDTMLAIARSTKRIAFEHNLILIHKDGPLGRA